MTRIQQTRLLLRSLPLLSLFSFTTKCHAPRGTLLLNIDEEWSTSVGVEMRRPLPSIYSCLLVSFWGIFPRDPACNHHGGDTRRRHVKGGRGWLMQGYRRTLGVAAPRYILPMTSFHMAVACWAWVVSLLILAHV